MAFANLAAELAPLALLALVVALIVWRKAGPGWAALGFVVALAALVAIEALALDHAQSIVAGRSR